MGAFKNWTSPQLLKVATGITVVSAAAACKNGIEIVGPGFVGCYVAQVDEFGDEYILYCEVPGESWFVF